MAGSIKHRHQTVVASVGADVDKTEWNDSHVMAGGTDGQLMTRDSGAADGWSWQAAPTSGMLMTGSQVETGETTSSTTYADLATAGPSVTVTLTGSVAILWFGAGASRASTGNSAFVTVLLSGANTLAASDTNCSQVSESLGTGALVMFRCLTLTGLAAGSTTFKLQYRCDGGGPWTFNHRSIVLAYQ